MKLATSGGAAILRRSSGFCSRKWILLYSNTATDTDSLYRRISRRGNPDESIVPVLDRWIQEGRNVEKNELQNMVKELRRYRRFKHALEVSQWMGDKRFMTLTKRDMAARLDLISKVYGLGRAEMYFNSIPAQFKDPEAYGILLNCYARSRLVEKAEATMAKMRELGFLKTTFPYTVMLNLYRQTKDYQKLQAVFREMEENDIKPDSFTFGIILSAYADTSDVEGMRRILKQMDSYPKAGLDRALYSIAANAFIKAGDKEKALAMLKKSELAHNIEVQSEGFEYILSQYADLGRKDEVLRIWELRKKAGKLVNQSYIRVISSILKFDDIDGAEKIFADWDSHGLSYDFRVPDLLVGAYCRKGLLDKAEELINKAVARGINPFTNTWYLLASGYVGANQMPKAVEAMKSAVSAIHRPGWAPDVPALAACLEYLKEKGGTEDAVEILRLLLSKEIISPDVHDRLFFYAKDSKSSSPSAKDAFGQQR